MTMANSRADRRACFCGGHGVGSGLREWRVSGTRRFRKSAMLVSHRRTSTGKKQHAAVVLKQGVQARGLKLLARDAREQAGHAGISTADYFCGIAQTGELTREGVAQFVKSLPDGTTELMCHPGYTDAALQKTHTRLQDSRQTELQILTDTGIRNLVASLGIRLIDYGFVTQEA